jgi:hypothetical protein
MGLVVQHPQPLLDDMALERRVVAEVGDDLFQAGGVQDGAFSPALAMV